MRLETEDEHASHLVTNGSSHANGNLPTDETNGYHTNGHGSSGAVTLPPTGPFYGHNREEVTRILLQSLSDLGYHGAARQLSHESGYELEIPSVAAFRSAVQAGEWDEAERLLFGEEAAARDGGVAINGHSSAISKRKSGPVARSRNGVPRNGLPLAEGADKTSLRFLLRQQKYLEMLENRDLNAALAVLRSELTPLKRDVGRLHALSSLMMCQSASDLRLQAAWDGAQGESRSLLLSEISQFISPSVMIPEHRLATLFTAVQNDQILGCRYHNTTAQPSLYTDHECSADDFPLQTLTELRDHADEVWCIDFSPDGTMLATGSQDAMVCVYDTTTWRLQHEFREHDRSSTGGQNQNGIVSIAFSPDSQYLISCSYTKEFVVVNVRDGRRVAIGDHFDHPVTSAAWLPDSQTFVIGSQSSQRPLGLYSLRTSSPSSSSIVRNNEIHSWREPPWDANLKDNGSSFRVVDCAVSKCGTRMAAATTSHWILLFDLETKLRVGEWAMEDRLMSVNFSSDGEELLVNMMDGQVRTLNSVTGDVNLRFEGATFSQFVIRSSFGGAGENFVASGSEDSTVYIWRRQTGLRVATIEAHNSGSVNAVAWHPTDPAIFVTAGDDRRVKVWCSANKMSLR